MPSPPLSAILVSPSKIPPTPSRFCVCLFVRACVERGRESESESERERERERVRGGEVVGEGGTGRQGGREMETGRGVGRVSSSYCRFSMLYPYAYYLCMVDTVSIHRLHKHTPNTHYHHTATCRGKVAHVCLCFCLSVSVSVSVSLSVRAVWWESSHARFRSSPLLSFSRSVAVRGSRTKCYHAQACISPRACADLEM